MQPGFAIWLTGLSGSGKTTLSRLLEAQLARRGVHVEVLDGDELRAQLCAGLGFSREDRTTNVRRVGYVAKLLARSGACVIVALISPYRATRDEQRASIPRFVEVYCKAELQALMARDPKGLYRRALAGEIKNFTGVDDPYEPPHAPEVVCETDREPADESVARIMTQLALLGYIEPDAADGAGQVVELAQRARK
jgi:adenylyl-sulfate kinase